MRFNVFFNRWPLLLFDDPDCRSRRKVSSNPVILYFKMMKPEKEKS